MIPETDTITLLLWVPKNAESTDKGGSVMLTELINREY
jgi:hypothetical protein